MRIVKSQALAALRSENATLGSQMQKCRRQIAKFCGIRVGAMSGQAAGALEQKMRMQSAIVVAHLSFYESLRTANSRNAQLVSALPETSSGVLDTAVATQRKEAAEHQIRMLEQQMDNALLQAQRINDSIREALETGELDEWEMVVSFVSVNSIRARYEALIRSQRLIVNLNENVLQKARQYESDSSSAYQSVQTSYVDQAMSSSRSFLRGRGWGDASWVGRMYTMRTSGRLPSANGSSNGVLQRVLRGEYKTDKAFAGARAEASTKVLGIAATGVASGNLAGLSVSVKPFGTDSKKRGKNDRSLSLGGQAQAEFFGAEAELTGDVGGLLSGSLSGSALSGGATGTLGASLFLDGAFNPALEASLKVDGSVLTGGTDLRVGPEDLNAHAKAEGKLLTAEAEAKAHMDAQGVEVRAGAEAYAVTGELSGGLTFLGTRFDASLDAKVGGAGANAGAKVGLTDAEGELGLGLGLGLGIKLKADWSGTIKALDDVGTSFSAWWNDLSGK